MSQSFERATSRLDNIRTIQPLLSALRTMSMGAWQMANKKIAGVTHYENNLVQILSELVPKVTGKRISAQGQPETSPTIADAIVLIIGSERGLCGKFNTSIADKALQFIDQNNFSDYQIWVMGSRLLLEIERRGVPISWRKPLPASGLISYQEAYLLTQKWLEQYETYAFNQVIILYNQVARGGAHQFTSFKLLPYDLQAQLDNKPTLAHRWPPAIIETDPRGIYHQIIQHFITVSFFKSLLLSAAAEHSARYHLMQEANDNAEDIIQELVRILNAERKRRITQQMQEIAVSAGLIKS
jgi:F-type H+-transporting ATPase subunit gamma